ncbi:type IV pilus assembly protein PilY1 [Gammaproteobacteria bacterium]
MPYKILMAGLTAFLLGYSVSSSGAGASISSVTASPSSISLNIPVSGNVTQTVTITVKRSSSAITSISLTLTGLPTTPTGSVTASAFSPSTVTSFDGSGNGTSTFTLTVTSAAVVTSTSLTVTASASGVTSKTKSISLDLSINGAWSDFKYVFRTGDDLYTSTCIGGGNGATAEDCTAIRPWDTDWRMLSASENVTYYNPSVVYTPWPGLSNASFTGALSNPQIGQAGASLSRNLSGFMYEVAVDDSGFSGLRPKRGTVSNRTTGANGLVDLWDSHTRYTVNTSSVDVTSSVFQPITTPGVDPSVVTTGDVKLNPTVTTSTLSSSTTCYSALGGGTVSCRTIAQAQQNIANWYQYYRRRSLMARGAIANVITSSPNYRYGMSVINKSSGTGSLFVETPSSGTTDYTSHNSTMLASLYDFVWASNSTPLRVGLDQVGKYFRGTLTGHTTNPPMTSACQQNFTVLLTDGYWNETTAPSGIGDADADTRSVTLADVARYYYITDLSTTLANTVPTTTFDTATWQHMVTFGVAFGLQGSLVDTDGDGWPNPLLAESGDWGNPLSSTCTSSNGECPERIDDLWHAGYNSRGGFASASNPEEVQAALSDALHSIAGRTATAASISTNSTRLDTGTLIYQAQFNSADWTGRLLAYKLNSDGSIYDPNHNGNIIEDAAWDTNASGSIPSSSSRNVYTWNATTGVVFDVSHWNNLSASQQSALQNGGSVTAGQNRLDWIRGDQSLEQPNGSFRARTYLLGDLVNSNPAFVSATNFGYDNLPAGTPGQSSYSSFVNTSQSRTKMLYAGANDGLLHGFNATTGVEKFAFFPNSLFSNLSGSNTLTDSGYSHKYFIDGSPQAGDAYFLSPPIGNGVATDPNNWRTVLVGSLGAGGKSIFALDVTTPDSFSQSKILWEFSDSADLGYTIGQFIQPSIGRTQDGSWVVIFGNGYASTNNHAILYVVNLITGALLKKIDTGAGSAGSPNGLAGPVLVSDDYRTIKYVYAGDMLGNLWKFDLSSSTTSNWGVAFKNVTTAKPLFQAHYYSASPLTDVVQPITAPPEVGSHPNGGYMVFFGTGKYFETGDHTTTAVQSLYGIWDKDDGTTACTQASDSCVFPTNRSTLQVQTILAEPSSNGNTWRVVSQNTIDWASKRGWYLDLLQPPSATAKGERVVNVPILNNSRALFTTLLPSLDPCAGGGSSWIMEVDMLSGGRTSSSLFDVNQDGLFNSSDFVTATGVGTVAATGLYSGSVGIINTPSIISAGEVEYMIAGGSSGSILNVRKQGNLSSGRQSWRQLR